MLLSTHWLEDVPYIADRVHVLDSGRVASLGPASSLAGLGAPQSRLYQSVELDEASVQQPVSWGRQGEVGRASGLLIHDDCGDLSLSIRDFQ